MPIQAMYESLDGRLVEVAKIGRSLSGLLAQHHCLRVYKPTFSILY